MIIWFIHGDKGQGQCHKTKACEKYAVRQNKISQLNIKNKVQ